MSSEGEIGRGDRLRRRCTVEFCGGVRVGGRGRLLVFFFRILCAILRTRR